MTENFDYLGELTIEPTTGLYNLCITTYNGNNVDLNVFICERRHNMKMNLVSNELYGTTKWVGTLCMLNNIIDPYSIKEGDILFYCSQTDATTLMVVPEIVKQSGIEELMSQAKSDLINALKKRKKDVNIINKRPNDILPPTVLPSNAPQIVVEQDKIKIAPNIFKNPNVEPVSLTPTPGSLAEIKTDDQTIEKVLINRYIKKIS